MVVAVLAFLFGTKLYGVIFGAPLHVPYRGDFKLVEPAGDMIRVLSIFAPGVILFVPLLLPSVRKMARQYPLARRHCDLVAGVALVCWLASLVAWLLGLTRK